MSYIPAALRRTSYNYQVSQRAPGGFASLPALDQHQLRAGVEHVVQLGERALCELLLEVAEHRCDRTDLLARLRRWQQVSPELLHAAGGDRFPPAPLRSVGR